MIKSDYLEPGMQLEIDVYGNRHKAVVQPDQPLWDPENQRIRA
jgi:dimethylglycine dehydrogenase